MTSRESTSGYLTVAYPLLLPLLLLSPIATFHRARLLQPTKTNAMRFFSLKPTKLNDSNGVKSATANPVGIFRKSAKAFIVQKAVSNGHAMVGSKRVLQMLLPNRSEKKINVAKPKDGEKEAKVEVAISTPKGDAKVNGSKQAFNSEKASVTKIDGQSVQASEGIKEAMREVRPRTQWAIGSGNLVDIWRDNWLGSASLKDALNLTNHELKDCNSKIWSWLRQKFKMRGNFNKLNDAIKLSHHKKPDILKCLRQVRRQIHCSSHLSKAVMYSEDTQILSDWGIQGKLRTAPQIESVNGLHQMLQPSKSTPMGHLGPLRDGPTFGLKQTQATNPCFWIVTTAMGLDAR
ncbi:hypothetical protein IFM89_011488 [Coptis chinensis]|uniref:Uncharacterized protein n=1 Tax=Coptis chinensis TaxID=261450 RepID=A0A835M4M3_9MAGN|nr:hypothetical protein IFM89_011488 [Coptis chinensis]